MMIFPAAYIGYGELFYSLKDMGDVLVICEKDFLDEYPLNENYITDDFKDTRKLIGKIEEFRRKNKVKFSGIIGIDDEEQFQISKKIADYFDLNFYADESCKIATNKFLMKKRFRENGVPTGEFELITDNGSLGFPNVLKLISGTGSEFVFFNDGEGDLKGNLELIKKGIFEATDDLRLNKIFFKGKEFDPRNQFLLEEFISGDEFSCDFMIAGNYLKILRIVKKFESDYFGLYTAYHLFNRQSMNAYGINETELLSICNRISKALGITEGVCMVDFKIKNGKISVIETSLRPGLSTFIHLMNEVYGYTSLGALCNLKKGLSMGDIPQDEGLVVHLIAPKRGVLKKFDTTKLRKELNIIDICEFDDEGDEIEDYAHDHANLIIGYVLIKNPKNVVDTISKIKSNVEIIVEDEGK